MSNDFVAAGRRAMANPPLQQALQRLRTGFQARRRAVAERLPEFEALRDAGRDMKDHTLAHLDHYLELLEARVIERGGQVHWCRDADEARRTILDICRAVAARTVTKSKSMVAEEIGINDFLEKHGIEPVETDLGEYSIQLRHEPPSHIIAPAIHLDRHQVAATFAAAHRDLPAGRPLDQPRQLLDEARAVLRRRFLAADVGITGANLLVAETGSVAVVSNEGNADLTMILPRVHIVLSGIEKVVPTMDDAQLQLRLLARSATGQEMASYTTFVTGPDVAAGSQLHVVLLDNGRSGMLGGPFQDMLRCIRCAACLNHCPVYGSVGGHAYGWAYSGPMGAVLIPALVGLAEARHLPQASTLCGRCEAVCPMRIPLPRLLRHWRERAFERHLMPARARLGLAAWGVLARHPRLYRLATAMAAWGLARLADGRGRVGRLPLAGGWTDSRDLPAPSGATFMAQWQAGKRRP